MTVNERESIKKLREAITNYCSDECTNNACSSCLLHKKYLNCRCSELKGDYPDTAKKPAHVCGDPNSPCDMECVERTQWSQLVKDQKKNNQPPKLEWECINDNPDGSSDYRARVFGGWLVKSVYNVCSPPFHQLNGNDGFGYEWRASIAFVPDPNREWTGETENS